jgi:lipoprotein-anchoring transpeptidase ErfK/SrfK
MARRPPTPEKAIQLARAELRRGNPAGAIAWAELAAGLAPEREEPWLILAAASEPEASLSHARRALQIHPNSERARRAVAWAQDRLGKSGDRAAGSFASSVGDTQPTGARVRRDLGSTQPSPALGEPRLMQVVESQSGQQRRPVSSGAVRRGGRRLPKHTGLAVFGLVLLASGCILTAAASWVAVNTPVLTSLLSMSGLAAPVPTQAPFFAQASIAKPTYTPTPGQDQGGLLAGAGESVATPTPAPEEEPTEFPQSPTASPTPFFEPTVTSGPTETPGVMYAEIVPDTPTPEYVPPAPAPAVPNSAASAAGSGEHWIDVDLSQQRVYAYEGDSIVNSFVVSTGTWQTPTVTGRYKVWIKLRSTTMTGPGYSLPNVPWVMYFYKGYGLHGTYWHNNFGVPMSHGCVNLTISDAAWLYDFSSVGTVVNVHY